MAGHKEERIVPGSFRDPSGFLFWKEGALYRQINQVYKDDYELLIGSGLYKDLADSGLLIPHSEAGIEGYAPERSYKIIAPKKVPFISYPYEWCFSQLKDAALATLEIQKRAMSFGMSLKDCSAYNIQFIAGSPVFIDTLSFEKYIEGRPWDAYRQFCQQFLAPLALMSHKDIRLGRLLRIYMDGLPLDLCCSMLPFSARLEFSLLMHICLHSKAQKHFAAGKTRMPKGRLSRFSLMGMVDSLVSAVRKLKWGTGKSQWSDYYEAVNYSPEGFERKKQIVADLLGRINPRTIWDIGANTGVFSRIAAGYGAQVTSFDGDAAATELNYLRCATEREKNILPLLLDLTNPSPSAGWNNDERMSVFERGPADTVFALALIHHLAISNNIPLSRIAGLFSRICDTLIIEFVPKDDSQAQRLLAARKDIFPLYSMQSFEAAFKEVFEIIECLPIKDSKRSVYLMKKRQR